MTATEGLTKVAGAAVESLKNSPLMLGMMLLNLTFVLIVFFGVNKVRALEHQQIKLVLDRCVMEQRHAN